MNNFYIGDDVRVIKHPETRGRIHNFDGSYVWVRIGEELIPMLEYEIELDKDRESGYLLGCLSACAMILIILAVVL